MHSSFKTLFLAGSLLSFLIGIWGDDANSKTGAIGALCLEDGLTSHPSKCNYFYDCWNGEPNLGRCPMSMLYNVDKSYCDYPKNVNCGNRKISDLSEAINGCPNTWGLYPNMDDCSTYYHCSRGRKISLAKCHNGLLFDSDQLTCNWPEKVNCRGAKKPPPMFACPEFDGYFANPNDCKKLFFCQKGQARMLGCSSGENYDNNLKRCVPSILGCENFQSKKEKARPNTNTKQQLTRRTDDKRQDSPQRKAPHYRENHPRIRTQK